MPAPSALLEYLLDQLAPIGQPQGRRMFSCHGLYLDGLFIGIIADETLYLKADELSQPAFQAAGMAPFTYSSRGRQVALSFWEAPADVIEDPQELWRWATEAVRAAGRARAEKRRRPRSSPS